MVDVKSNTYQALVGVWTTIEKLLPNEYKKCHLLPPSTEEKICFLEKEVKTRLPADYRLSLKIHEGATDWMWGSITLINISTIVEAWKKYLEIASDYRNIGATLEPYGEVCNDLFNPGWIPIAIDNDIPICIDMNPMPNGVVGQIIYVDWEDGTVKVLFNSFLEFLEEGAHKLESKRFGKPAQDG